MLIRAVAVIVMAVVIVIMLGIPRIATRLAAGGLLLVGQLGGIDAQGRLEIAVIGLREVLEIRVAQIVVGGIRILVILVGVLALELIGLLIELLGLLDAAGLVEEVLLGLQRAHLIGAGEARDLLEGADDLECLVVMLLIRIGTGKDDHHLGLRLALQSLGLIGEGDLDGLLRMPEAALAIGDHRQIIVLAVHAVGGAQLALGKAPVALAIGHEAEGLAGNVDAGGLLGDPLGMRERSLRIALLERVGGEHVQADVLGMLLAQPAQTTLVIAGEHGPLQALRHLRLARTAIGVGILRLVALAGLLGEAVAPAIAGIADRAATIVTALIGTETAEIAMSAPIGAIEGTMAIIAVEATIAAIPAIVTIEGTMVVAAERTMLITIERAMVPVPMEVASTTMEITAIVAIAVEGTTIVAAAEGTMLITIAIMIEATMIAIAVEIAPAAMEAPSPVAVEVAAAVEAAATTMEAALIAAARAIEMTAATLIVAIRSLIRERVALLGTIEIATGVALTMERAMAAITVEAAMAAVVAEGTMLIAIAIMIERTTIAALVEIAATTMEATGMALAPAMEGTRMPAAAEATAATAAMERPAPVLRTGPIAAAVIAVELAHLVASKAPRAFLPRRRTTNRPPRKSSSLRVAEVSATRLLLM